MPHNTPPPLLAMDSVRIFRLDGGLRLHPEVEQWFSHPPSELRLLARRWFNEMRSCGTDVLELLHDGQPTACVGNLAFGYVAAFRTHVNVGFFPGAALPDPSGLLLGTGRFMRHVKLGPGRAVNEEALAELVASAYAEVKARRLAEP
jgi:uncharacterized protein DUF1801